MNKTKKYIISSGLTFATIGILGFGAFAFFSSHSEQFSNATAGLVDITATNLNLTNPNNVNPGDNALDLTEGHRGGTEHNLTFNVENKGNKSVVTRNVLDLYVPYGTDSTGTASDSATVDITKYFLLDQNGNELKNKYYLARRTASSDVVVITPDELDNYTFNQIVGIRYIVDADSLNGVGEYAEIETSVDKFKTSYLYKLGMKKETVESDVKPLTTINIDVEVQAIQYRNTKTLDSMKDSDWNTIFKQTIEFKSNM